MFVYCESQADHNDQDPATFKGSEPPPQTGTIFSKYSGIREDGVRRVIAV